MESLAFFLIKPKQLAAHFGGLALCIIDKPFIERIEVLAVYERAHFEKDCPLSQFLGHSSDRNEKKNVSTDQTPASFLKARLMWDKVLSSLPMGNPHHM